MLDISPVKVSELASITSLPKSNVSRFIKSTDSTDIILKNNRVLGIGADACQRFLLRKDSQLSPYFKPFFNNSITMVTTSVGGSHKTSTVSGISLAKYRLTSKSERSDVNSVCVTVDMDPQGSLTHSFLKKYGDHVLTEHIKGTASVSEILVEVAPNFWLIGSNLEMLYADRLLSSPKQIKSWALSLIKDIFSHFKGKRVDLFFDCPPALGPTISSLYCALAQISQLDMNTNCSVLLPLRCDKTSLLGAKINISEFLDACSTFSLDPSKINISCFISAYDARTKLTMDVIKAVMEDELLSEYLAPVYVRYSAEVSKQAFLSKSVFSTSNSKMSPITKDYTDLAIYLACGESEASNA